MWRSPMPRGFILGGSFWVALAQILSAHKLKTADLGVGGLFDTLHS